MKKIFGFNKKVFSLKQKKPKYDESQTKFFGEELLLVNEKDDFIKGISKLDAHLKEKANIYPHRAFSVFLFDKNNRLLLQRRSTKKITFPFKWSNTCCSHPLATEMDKENNKGIREAASRRLVFELNIKIDVNSLFPIEKILYRADSDETFEEFEMDYIIFGRIENLNITYNKNEVSEIMFLEDKDFKTFMRNEEITPWFKIIAETKLEDYYLIQKNKLKNETNLKIINFC